MNTCPNCGLVKGLHASILPGCMCPFTPQQTEYVSEGDIRALKHRIHELEGELLGYKKIVADQDSIMTAQAMRIVDLKTHIENFDGEDR